MANAIQSHWMFYFPPTSSPGRHTQLPASPQDLQSCKIHFSHTETCRLKALGRVLGQEGGGEETNRTFRSPSSVCVQVSTESDFMSSADITLPTVFQTAKVLQTIHMGGKSG